jgi:eukaryotic-like serine/threonine-protein kinase
VTDAGPKPLTPEEAVAVRAELDTVLASPAFASPERLRRFLRYLVERALAGQAGELKEYAIGLDVFDRDASYDPRVDSTVRVHAGKLRDRLREYYLSAGKESPVRIDIPKGTYAPVFAFPGTPKPPETRGPVPRRALLLAAVGAAIVGIVGGAIWQATRTATAPPVFSPVSFRRGMITAARFASDGQSVLYTAAWEGRPLELFLTRPGTSDSRSLELPGAHLLATGPNGELAVGVRAEYRGFFQFGGTLARTSLAGGVPRELLTETLAADIAPDGTLAVVRRAAGHDRVEWPPGRVVFEGPQGGWLGDLRISRDGSRIAFLSHPLNGDNLGSLYVADREGAARRLGGEWAGIQGTAWAPGGREIWFAASRSATDHGLYAMALSGRMRTVWSGPETFVLHDVAANGRVLLSLENMRLHVMAQPPGETERDVSWLDGGCSCALSQDGKTLAIGEGGIGGGPRMSSYLRPLDGATAVRLGDGIPMALSPDGAWVLAYRHDSPQHPVLLPTGAGSARDLAADGVRFVERGSWLPDSRRVLLVGRAGDRPPRTYVARVDGGAPEPLTPEGVTGVLVSPDGSRLLVRRQAANWMVFQMADGKMTAAEGLSGLSPIVWSDAANVVYARAGDIPARIYRVNLESGKREEWRQLKPADPAGAMAIQHVQVTPSGNAMAYTYFQFDARLIVAEGLR